MLFVGLQHDVIYVDQPWGLPVNLTLLPQHLRNLGYETHAVGKVLAQFSFDIIYLTLWSFVPSFSGFKLFP